MKKQKKDFRGLAAVETCRAGAYVKRIVKGQPTAQNYVFEGYCRGSRKYILTKFEDHCAQIYVKKGKIIFIDCNY